MFEVSRRFQNQSRLVATAFEWQGSLRQQPA